MSNKEKILACLELNSGKLMSGGHLSKELGISRTAVWKNIQGLIDEGYPIISVANKGYYLEENSDILSEYLIKENLNTKFIGKNLEVHKSVGSTNDMMKKLARDDSKEGMVLLAEEQTKGRGRRGREFHSPNGKGIYMSLLLRPDMEPDKALNITIVAAVAEALVLEEQLGLSPKIKWVNDIFLGDKKVSGILTEASMEMESGKLEYVIIGIGVNVSGSNDSLPDEIKEIASFVSEFAQAPVSRNLLAASILNKFEDIYMNWDFKDVIREYKKRSYLEGKEVTVIKGGSEYGAKVLDIDDKGSLVVEYESGEKDVLSSGEVSVRKRP